MIITIWLVIIHFSFFLMNVGQPFLALYSEPPFSTSEESSVPKKKMWKPKLAEKKPSIALQTPVKAVEKILSISSSSKSSLLPSVELPDLPPLPELPLDQSFDSLPPLPSLSILFVNNQSCEHDPMSSLQLPDLPPPPSLLDSASLSAPGVNFYFILFFFYVSILFEI
jgi:hypothetical protein